MSEPSGAWSLDDQKRRCALQPFGQHDLLLVAARQIADKFGNAAGLDAEGIDRRLRRYLDRALAHDTCRGMFGQAGGNQVVAKRLFQKEALGLAFFGYEPDPGAHRVAEGRKANGRAMQ